MTTGIRSLQVTFQDRYANYGNVLCNNCLDFVWHLQEILAARDTYTALREVKISQPRTWPHEQRLSMSLNTLKTTLQLPKSRPFEHAGGIVPLESTDVDEWRSLEASSSVSSIKLESTDIDTFALGHLIRSCKTLRTFEIRWMFGDEDDYATLRPWGLVDLNDIVESLTRHCDTLSSLTLTNVLDQGRLWDTAGSINPLSSFSQLESVTVDEHFFRRSNGDLSWTSEDLNKKLPTSLHYLLIHTEKSLSDISTLLQNVGLCKAKDLIHLELTFPMDSESENEQEAIRLYGPGFEGWTLESYREEFQERIKFGVGSTTPIAVELRRLAEVFKIS